MSGHGKLYMKRLRADGSHGPEEYVGDVTDFRIHGPATLREAIAEILRFTHAWKQSNDGDLPQLYLDCDKATRDDLKDDADRHMAVAYVQRNPDKPVEIEILGAKVRIVDQVGMRVSIS